MNLVAKKNTPIFMMVDTGEEENCEKTFTEYWLKIQYPLTKFNLITTHFVKVNKAKVQILLNLLIWRYQEDAYFSIKEYNQ